MKLNNVLFLGLCLIGLRVWGQTETVKSDKKPLIDTTNQKGFLGGRLSTGLEGTLDEAKKSSRRAKHS